MKVVPNSTRLAISSVLIIAGILLITVSIRRMLAYRVEVPLAV